MTTDTAEAANARDHAAKGLAFLAGGRFPDALATLRKALSLGDREPATILNLAIAEDRAGDRIRAQALIRLVEDCVPGWDEPPLRLAESLRTENNLTAAEAAYRRVLALNPTRPSALIALAGLLLQRSQTAEARALLQRCCEAAPDHAEAWEMVGVASPTPAEAHAAFVRSQQLDPSRLTAMSHGIKAALQAGQAAAELVRLEAECLRQPLNPVPLAGLGMLLEKLGRRDDGIDAVEAATELAPDNPQLFETLGGMLACTAHAKRAEAAFRRASALQPDNPEVQNNHAAMLMRIHRHDEARAILLDVQQHHGPHTAAVCNLANATACAGLQAEAVAIARQAIARDPSSTLPWRTLCNTLPYQDGTTAAELLDAARHCAATLSRSTHGKLLNDPDPERALTVGLLSGTFRSHPVGWLTIAGFETLDPQQFRLICLSQNTLMDDPISRRFQAAAQEWVDVDGLPDAQLVGLARDRGIDILIDLGGYGDAARMIACASRLAPVQIKWVGMQNHSSGLPEMDWILTDRWETPPGFEPFYSERLLRMADGYVCYSPPVHAPDVGQLPAIRNGHITFGCFNNLAKITPRVVATWSTILQRVPDARMILKTHQLSDPVTAARLRGAFASHGIADHRIAFRGSSGHRAFMGEYNDIDIALDPFPYSGGLTVCEALWMGVPTLALAGEIFAARHSASHLSNAGLPDWVTDSLEAYVTTAERRASDTAALAALRDGLRERVRRSPLCDAPRFGRSLGDALRSTWRAWCSGAG